MELSEWMQKIRVPGTRAAIPLFGQAGLAITGKPLYRALTGGRTHAAAIIALAEKYPAAASTLIMDTDVEAEAFGCELIFTEHDLPVVKPYSDDPGELAAIEIPMLDAGRIPQFLLAARLVKEKVVHKPVFAGCIGPFTLAGRIWGMKSILGAVHEDPEPVLGFLEKAKTFLTRYIKAFRQTGVDGILMDESAMGMLSPELCERFSAVFARQIVAEVQDEHFLCMLHNCGNTAHVTSMVSTGAGALHFGSTADLLQLMRDVPPGRLVLGNIDPVAVMKTGSAAEVYRTVAGLLDQMKPYPNFILSTGCDTPPGVPPENLEAFFQAASKFR